MPKRAAFLRFAAFLLAPGLILAAPAFAAGAWETDAQAYSIRLENQKVRVLDVTYPPGHKVPSHTLRDRLVVVNQNARLRTEDSSGRIQEYDARTGEMAWAKAETLSIENIGSTEYRATIIEIK